MFKGHFIHLSSLEQGKAIFFSTTVTNQKQWQLRSSIPSLSNLLHMDWVRLRYPSLGEHG